MHLKRVELENFKSFGRRLSIPFLEGFTAITGPNGSGKSNIGDAILFVLGPKSNKAIRAGKLTDLIFNGGKERKPADHCRVSLVFDNSDRVIPVDGDEVTLTRHVKLSRSDPTAYYSHFYVNGKPSSLGEFDSLLAHSRISAEGYNIVRQGDVTRIVEMTPLERRRVVDDIAGITKFDQDIARASAERGVVEQNLDRVRIILEEIDRQLAHLERERAEALRYKAAKEALDGARARLARKREITLVADLASVHRQISSQGEERARLESTIASARLGLADAEREVARLEGKIAEAGGEEARELKRRIDDLKGQAIRATERVNYAKDELADLRRERGEVEGDLRRAEKDATKLEKERLAREAERVSVEERHAARSDALAALRERISRSAGRAAEVQREMAELRAEHERAQGGAHEARLSVERLGDRAGRLEAQAAEAAEAVSSHEFEVKDLEWQLKEIRKETEGGGPSPDGLRRDLFGKKRRESELSQELRELEPTIRRLQNDYAKLKAEQDASEAVSRGYTRAVDAVLAARDQGALRGICGTIAELATVDPRLDTAMEVAAGGRLQAIVTETDADAAAAIEHLKRNRLGRATFLPLNKMVPGRPAGKPLMAVRSPDAEGFAIDLVRFDEKYRNAFWYVFRDTVIVKSLDAARRLMGGVRLVTLDGDLVDAGGAMTGGEAAHAERNRLKFGASQREELEKVAARLRGAIGHQEALSADLQELRQGITDLETRIRELTQSAATREERLAGLEKRRREQEERLKAAATQKAATDADLATVRSEIARATEALAAKDEAVAVLETRREDLGRQLLAATSKELARELESLSSEVESLREKGRDLASEVETRRRGLEILGERRSELETRLARMDAARVDHEKALAESEALLVENERQLSVLLALESQQNEELKTLSAARDRAWKGAQEIRSRLDKLSDQLETAGDMLVQLNARVPSIEEALAEVRQELRLYPDVPVDVVESLDELRARARRIEHEIEALGNVNMRALEEYDRQSARAAELKAEIERLAGERDHCERLIADTTAKKRVEFFKVFDEINKNFADVFGRLSDGGMAELVLENPEDPFAGGLTMRAQPKGKKVTRLEALSGGEKSLASMGFIFALQEYSPSPFYYLDEVDQNLDGINSELLAKMVRANSRYAQSIVVSLRKVTLKEADHVYGVTMMETGLSEVVGEVRISEIVEEPTVAGVALGGRPQ